jgi:predicted DNA-binding transcriptional regulator AlpA
MEPVTRYLTSADVRARFGDISDMTLWRWLQNKQLEFPRPLLINRRRFFRLEEIEAFEMRAVSAAKLANELSDAL